MIPLLPSYKNNIIVHHLQLRVMANTGSVIIKKSQLQTLCLVVLLLPLPLLYLLHMHMTREYAYIHKLHMSSRGSMEGKLSRYNSTHSLPPATVRRVLVRDTRRVHSIRTPKTSSVYASARRRCKNRICREYLSESDLGHFTYCWRKTHLSKEPQRSQCHFINGTHRAPVALASFPGSGNTWVRGLLQRASGICTGAIYCDKTLRVSGYPGESLRSGNTLVVKTHQIDPRWTGIVYPPNTTDSYFRVESHIPVYDATILLIRNPFHAMVSEWNRLMTVNMTDNHIKTVGANFFCEFDTVSLTHLALMFCNLVITSGRHIRNTISCTMYNAFTCARL